MRKIIKLSLLLFVIGLSSCNSPLKKSVIEPLKIKDLKVIIEKDTLFEFTYKAIQEIRESKLTDDVEKAKWSDMTYNRVHKIAQFYSDSLKQSNYLPQIKSEWESKYSNIIQQVDSISDYWEKYKKENALINYVNIELFDVQTKQNGIPEIGFKITPLKGAIDKIYFDFVFIDKKNKGKLSERDKFTFSNDNLDYISLDNKITESKIIWKRTIIDIVKNKLLEEVLEDYDFEMKINSITKNGYKINSYDIKIPNSVEMMWKYGSGFKENVIEEFLNVDFLEFYRFKSVKIDSIARTIDPKAIEFLELTVEK